MALDPQVRHVLELIKLRGLPQFHEQPPAASRAQYEETAPVLAMPPADMARVSDRTIPGPDGNQIPLRIYSPRPREGEKLPVLVYLHGGGWVVGSLDTHDSICRALARRADCIVVSVDYRMAPEHPFPAAPDDCHTALRWVAENAATFGGDAARLAVGGDSAGGNLAAVAALDCRDRGGPALALQLLVYPVTADNLDSASCHAFATDHVLTRETMQWFIAHYTGGTPAAGNPRYAPLLADDLSGLAPAHVMVAGYDPLRDEGIAYATRLMEAGNTVTLVNHAGMVHGFFGMGALIDEAYSATDQAARALQRAWGGR